MPISYKFQKILISPYFSSTISKNYLLMSERSGKLVLVNLKDLDYHLRDVNFKTNNLEDEVSHSKLNNDNMNYNELFFTLINEKIGNSGIYISKEEILEDHFRKYVKFYPYDDIFSSSDNIIGIRIWDTIMKEIIYTHKDPSKVHVYSKNGILSAISEFGVKIYDLRVRSSVDHINIKGAIAIDYNENSLEILTENGYFSYDDRVLSDDKIEKIITNESLNFNYKYDRDIKTFYRNSGKILNNYENRDLKIVGGFVYLTQKVENNFLLFRNNISKRCIGSKISEINNEAVVFSKNIAEIHGLKQNKKLIFNDGVEKIDNILSLDDHNFLFADGCVFLFKI
ncbi:hypothetical protein DMUE_1071 [Dictyocoela muelleri]|nr:hypothetical protein DMUE_1071 [Dictyocoela muelleri]